MREGFIAPVWDVDAGDACRAHPWAARSPSRPARRRRRRPAGRGRSRQLHLRAVTQPIAALGDHDLAGGEARGDGDALPVDDAQGHGPHLHRAVGLHDVDEGGHDAVRRAAAHRGVRHDDLVLQGFLEQLDVDELIREQRAVGVVEQRPQFDRARGRVDGIVERQQLAFGEFGAVGAVVGFDREGAPFVQPPHQRRHVVFGNRKDHRDRLHLVDDDDPVRITRRDVVALVDLAQSHAAGHRRDDVRVDQIHLRGLQLALVRFDGALVLVDQRALSIELLHGDGVLLHQTLIARQVQFGVREQRLVAAQVALHLLHGGFIGAGVYLRKQVSLVHQLPFGKGDLLQVFR